MLDHKESFNKLQRIKTMKTRLFNHDVIQLENLKRKGKNIPSTLNVNNMSLIILDLLRK